MEKNMFLPAFGNRPHPLVGREEIISQFTDGLKRPPGHPLRVNFYMGQRGMGKTALLLEFAARAEDFGFVAARVTASERMTDEIIQTIQVNGEKHTVAGTHIKGVNAGALGFSFGLTFSDETEKKYGFRIKLSLLADELAKQRKGILILVDEVRGSGEAMRELATTYQHLIGEDKNIAIAMAGLPGAVSNVLNDKVLTFLNRANKAPLGTIALPAVSLHYADCLKDAGKSIEPDLLERAVQATRGYPYLLQLIGYYIMEYANGKAKISDEIVTQAIRTGTYALAENVHDTCLKPLSETDIAFLTAMAKDGDKSTLSQVMKQLGISNSYAQQYRQRLLEAGVITSERRGQLAFAVPYLSEYLREEL
jgi:hypothetical protein